MEALTNYLNQERGRQIRLAEALGIHPSAISQWTRVPVDRVNDVAHLTGISREMLRPDVFCPDTLQDRAVVARVAHNHEVEGSSPSPATSSGPSDTDEPVDAACDSPLSTGVSSLNDLPGDDAADLAHRAGSFSDGEAA